MPAKIMNSFASSRPMKNPAQAAIVRTRKTNLLADSRIFTFPTYAFLKMP